MTTSEAAMTRPKRRYAGRGNDKHFGPLTWCTSSWRHWGVMFDSGGGEERDGSGCHVLFYLGALTLICELPNFIRNFTIEHRVNGELRYTETFPREYGFSYGDGAVHWHYGPQTDDSVTTRGRVWFVPWLQHRHVRFSLYGLAGEHFWTQYDKDMPRGAAHFEEQRYWEDKCPKARFQLLDYDKDVVTATTHIEEREWRRGTGWAKWLSLFCRPRIQRSLRIQFDKETGTEKGSWKGGATGACIEVLPDELHEAAFFRYCEQEHRAKGGRYRVKFVGRVS